MFENLGHFFKRMVKTEQQKELGSKDAAKERLHLVLVQDRANVSADFLELMKQEIIEVIKKYIVVDEDSIDVRLTNQPNSDGTNGAPVLYANIPIVNIKNDMMAEKIKEFKGVDFNKEMGLTGSTKQEEAKTETTEVIELPEKNDIDNDINNNEEEKKDIISEKEQFEEVEDDEIKEVFEEVDDDEDEDDVTFDDLLKAAEEADKASQEQLEDTEKKNTKNVKTKEVRERRKKNN